MATVLEPSVVSPYRGGSGRALLKENYLSEFSTEEERAAARDNLGVYAKEETCTSEEVDSRIESAVGSALEGYAERTELEAAVGKVREEIGEAGYVRSDGTVPFTAPQSGVDAESGSDLVTLSQLDNRCEGVEGRLGTLEADSVWLTSGPVLTTVGYVEDNSELPASMTLQQVCDAIFYGRLTGLSAPEYAGYGDTVCVTVWARNVTKIDSVDIYMDGMLVATVTSDMFTGSDDGGYVYVWCTPEGITGDVEWRAVYRYDDGGDVEETAHTALSCPVFAGMVPYWWNVEEDVTIGSLRRLAKGWPERCVMRADLGPDLTGISFGISFEDSRGMSLVVALPYGWPDLTWAATAAQGVGPEAFAKWTQPMRPYGRGGEVVMYKIYVFNQTLYRFDGTVTLSFGVSGTDKD